MQSVRPADTATRAARAVPLQAYFAVLFVVALLTAIIGAFFVHETRHVKIHDEV